MQIARLAVAFSLLVIVARPLAAAPAVPAMDDDVEPSGYVYAFPQGVAILQLQRGGLLSAEDTLWELRRIASAATRADLPAQRLFELDVRFRRLVTRFDELADRVHYDQHRLLDGFSALEAWDPTGQTTIEIPFFPLLTTVEDLRRVELVSAADAQVALAALAGPLLSVAEALRSHCLRWEAMTGDQPCRSRRAYCTSSANSTGQRASAVGEGTLTLRDPEPLRVHVNHLPPNEPVVLLMSADANVAPLGDGVSCIGSASGRWRAGPAALSSSSGSVHLAVDLDFAGPIAIAPGASWFFQAFYRDPSGGPTGVNAANAIEVTFEP